MPTYCLGCKKHTGNTCPKKLIMMANKEIEENVLIVWLMNHFLIE